MNNIFEPPDGIGWVIMVAVIGLTITVLTALNLKSTEKEMEMALESGCSQMISPNDNRRVIWVNCSKSMPSNIKMEVK
jgi:hypothetical protein